MSGTLYHYRTTQVERDFPCLVYRPVAASGAPVPHGADAVVQIENTEQLPDRQDGEKRIKIVKVFLHTAVSEQVAIDNRNQHL